MKYSKILIDLKLWHLIPYKIERVIQDMNLIEYGFLYFRLVNSYEIKSKELNGNMGDLLKHN